MAFSNLRDGDAVVSVHGFIFYIFGYNHPEEAYEAFLKYVPSNHSDKFHISWLDTKWSYKGISLVRPRELFSPESHANLIMAFRQYFPDYIIFSNELNRWMIRVPRVLMREAFIPSRQLMLLKQTRTENTLERNALDLIEILSKYSRVPIGFFGVHGSISLGMHQKFSDIDITVYGASNYHMVKRALIELEGEGSLSISRENGHDSRRMNRGLFRNIDFVINATRRFGEIDRRKLSVKSLGEAEVECKCTNAEESVFRPAIYDVSDCSCIEGNTLNHGKISRVVSMIGLFRDLVRPGEKLRAKGKIELVNSNGSERYFRLVVGTGAMGEYLSRQDQACSSTTSPA